MEQLTKRPQESGFTLIELLVVISIIGLLASMGVTNYRILRARVYSSQVDSELHDLKTAIEAGRNDMSESGGFFGGWTMSSGPLLSWSGTDFLPGFVNRAGISVSAWYDADCTLGSSNPWCMQSGASITSCKSGKTVSSWTWGDGVSFDWTWQGSPWC